jgi:hypothetical protein
MKITQTPSLLCLLMLWIRPAESQWEFLVNNSGSTQTTLQMQMPVTYAETTCQFDFLGFYMGDWNPVQINNTLGCGLPHVLLLDGYRYELPMGFTLNITADEHQYTGAFSLGPCYSVSGNPINTGAPGLLAGGQAIQFVPSRLQHVFYRDGETYFHYESTNGDIRCQQGSPQPNLFDAVFLGDFE